MSEIVLVTLLMKTHKNSFCSVIWLMLLWYWLKIFRCFPYSSCFNYIWDSVWHWFYVIVSLGFVMQFQALFAEFFFFCRNVFFFLVKRDIHSFVCCYHLMRLNNLVCPFQVPQPPNPWVFTLCQYRLPQNLS